MTGRAMTWSLVTCLAGGGERAAARRDDGTIVALPEPLCDASGVMALLADWGATAALLGLWSPDDASVIAGAELLAPLRFPNKVLCAGANYRKHVAEMGLDNPGREWEPWFFLKTPTTTVVAGHGPVTIDPDPAARVDWEGELGVVIGRAGRNIAADEARDHVAGYVVLNDVSARGPHHRPSAPAPPFAYDWIASKSQDTFCPMGPGITPDWLIDDPNDLRLRLWVNGELQQDESTSDMILDTWALVAGASRWVTLEPGDVIATGTPSGVGAPRGKFLKPGDVVRVEIDGLGAIEHPVVAA